MAGRLTPERCTLVARAASVGVFLVYLLHAAVLIHYPWDWSPDEGLFLDYARRLLEAPGTLYPVGQSVPFPLVWTPLLPALLAPVVAWCQRPLAVARLLALAWTVAAAAGVYVLVRRRTTSTLGLAAAALSLAPMGLTFWFMLVRMDGLMTALWIWSAAVLVPDRLALGGGRLSWGRAFAGSLLIVLAFLAKSTAVLHAAPLVAAWLWIDRASGLRLIAAVGGLGALTVAALHLVTGGGFLWVQGLWGDHPWRFNFVPGLLRIVAKDTLLPLAAGAAAAVLATRAGDKRWREAALPMLIGALLIVPALGKYGSSSNYLVPVAAAVAVLVGRWLGAWAEAAASQTARAQRAALAAAACALVALLTLAMNRFPLPTPRDEQASAAFYSFVTERGAPILALRPDYAYYLLHQPVEVEGSSYVLMRRAGVPGIDVVSRRVEERYYRTIVFAEGSWFVDEIRADLERHYRLEGRVALGYFFGPKVWVILAPRD
jgi:hypothetical protein